MKMNAEYSWNILSVTYSGIAIYKTFKTSMKYSTLYCIGMQ